MQKDISGNKVNLVLVPSVIRNPLLSSFLSEEDRLNQVCETIKSICQKIPNAYVVVLEGGTPKNSDEQSLILSGASEVFFYDLEKNGKRLFDANRSKSYGEITLFTEYFNSLSFVKMRKQIKIVSKVGGRAILNDTFVFDDTDSCFVRWQEKSWSGSGACTQRYWKVPANLITHVVEKFNLMKDNFDSIIDIEHGFYQFGVVPMEKLEPHLNEGISHFVSLHGRWEHT